MSESKAPEMITVENGDEEQGAFATWDGARMWGGTHAGPWKAEYRRADLPWLPDAIALARLFHEKYEQLAPQFGYSTREETRDFDLSSPNGKLMVAVCEQILTAVEQKP